MNITLVILTVVIGLFASIIPVPGTDVWFSQFIAIAFFGCMFIAYKISEVSKAMAIFYAYATLSAVFIRHFEMMAFIVLLMTGITGLVLVQVSKLNAQQRNKLYIAFAVLLLIQIGYGFIQKLNLDPIFKLSTNPKLSDTVGFNGSHNQYSLFLSMLSPLAFNSLFITILVIVGIITSTSMSGLLGLMAGYVFFHRDKPYVLFAAIALVPALIFIFCNVTGKQYHTKSEERLGLSKLSISQVVHGKAAMELNENTTKIVTCNPLFGFGIDSFFGISPYTQRKLMIYKQPNGHIVEQRHRYEHAHNDFVEIFFDFGFIGISIFIYWLYELVARLRKIRWDYEINMLVSMLICISVRALSIYTIHTAYNGCLVAIIFGLIYGKVKELEKA